MQPEYYSLNKNDRVLHLSGVPISYLKKDIDITKLGFMPTSFGEDSSRILIPPVRQVEILNAVTSDVTKLGASGLYAIGSVLEAPSYDLATVITRLFYETTVISGKKVPNIKWVDLGRPSWAYLKSDEDFDIVAIHGVSESSDIKRLELCKDFMRRSEASTILLICVTPNILQFVTTKFACQPDAVWQLGRVAKRTIV